MHHYVPLNRMNENPRLFQWTILELHGAFTKGRFLIAKTSETVQSIQSFLVLRNCHASQTTSNVFAIRDRLVGCPCSIYPYNSKVEFPHIDGVSKRPLDSMNNWTALMEARLCEPIHGNTDCERRPHFSLLGCACSHVL